MSPASTYGFVSSVNMDSYLVTNLDKICATLQEINMEDLEVEPRTSSIWCCRHVSTLAMFQVRVEAHKGRDQCVVVHIARFFAFSSRPTAELTKAVPVEELAATVNKWMAEH